MKDISKIKKKIRSRKKWKTFRKKIMDEKCNTCELCGTKYIGKRKKMLNLHHINDSIQSYDDTNTDNYRLLCSDCHDLVEKMLIKLDKKTVPDNLEYLWVLLLSALNLLVFTNNEENYLEPTMDNTFSIADVYKHRQKKEKQYDRIKRITQTRIG